MLGAQVRREFSEVHMGLAVRIVLHARDDAAARVAARHAFARIAALDAALSDYRVDSEVRRLQERPGAWVRVSPELFAVLARAVAVARESGGAFDPTVGPLVTLWRDARRTGRLPDRAARDSARALVDWRRIQLDPARRRVRLAMTGMRLDLGAVAKGYVLQSARDILRQHGVRSALIEAGGDIVVGAPPPGRRGWHVEVPGAGPALAARAAALSHSAIATSGPSAQFVEVGGVRYSHVVDPRTGLGSTAGLASTVIAPDAATADALATALTLLGADDRRALLRRHPEVRAEVRPSPVPP
jgi:thiamine biosynthesis lipoprotein